MRQIANRLDSGREEREGDLSGSSVQSQAGPGYPGHPWSLLSALGLVALVSFQRPLEILAANPSGGLVARRLLLSGAITFVVAALLILALTRILRISIWRVALPGSVAVFAFFHWASVGSQFSLPSPRARTVAAYTIAFLVSPFLASKRTGRLVALGVAASLFVGPAGQVVLSQGVDKAPVPKAAPLEGAIRSTPDVYFIVLDGYARADVLKDVYGFDNAPFLDELRRRNFTIREDAKANYSMTYGSISSALTMSYVLREGRPVSSRTESALNDVTSGDNPVVSTLKASGYKYVHIESGMGATRCGEHVDECLSSSWLDEGVYTLLQRTPLSGLMESKWGHFFSYNGEDRLRKLVSVAREDSAEPRFVFAHILLPHPPLFLDSGCRLEVRAERRGLVLGSPLMRQHLTARRAAYADQVRCVNSLLSQAVGEMSPDSVVLIASDHGPDSREQLWTPIEDWTPAQIHERMSSLAAYRLPRACRDEGRRPPKTLVNSFRVILGCLFDTDVALLPDEHFLITRLIDFEEPTRAVAVPDAVEERVIDK